MSLILLVSSLHTAGCRRDGLTQEHAAGVFDVFLDLEGVSLRFHERGWLIKTYLDKEGDGFPAIEKTVVVGESEVHHLHIMLVQIQRSILGAEMCIQGGLRPCR